jgi:hypothetical protein
VVAAPGILPSQNPADTESAVAFVDRVDQLRNTIEEAVVLGDEAFPTRPTSSSADGQHLEGPNASASSLPSLGGGEVGILLLLGARCRQRNSCEAVASCLLDPVAMRTARSRLRLCVRQDPGEHVEVALHPQIPASEFLEEQGGLGSFVDACGINQN